MTALAPAPAPAAAVVRLGPADEARVEAAWAKIASEGHDRSIFNVRPLAEVLGVLRAAGAIGVEAPGGALAALGWNMVLPPALEPYVFAQLGHTEAGYVCTNAVVPEHRGQRLQRVVAGALLEDLAAAGHQWAAITVAPGNTASLRNLAACGFVQVGRGPVYGDHERLVLMAEIA